MEIFVAKVLVILSSARAQSVAKKINRESIKLPSWEQHKIKAFIESLKNLTESDDNDVVYDEISTYDEPGIVPELPVLKLFEDETLEVGKEIGAACVSKNGNPPSEIVWYLGGQQIDIALEFEQETDDATMSSVISVIQRNITEDDDNRNLVCQAWHPGYATGFMETKLKLIVNYKPMKLPLKIISDFQIGNSIDISVSFRSNPKPSSLIWLVGDRKVYYGAKASKYISKEISAAGDNYWNATLHITDLTRLDMLLNYTLRVKNALGGADYHLRFDGDEMAQSELETTSLEITTLSENEAEITTMEMEVLDETTNDSESNAMSDTTVRSDSENSTTEIDQTSEDSTTEDGEVSPVDYDDSVTEIQGILTILRKENEEILTKTLEKDSELERISTKSVKDNSTDVENSTKSNDKTSTVFTSLLEADSKLLVITTKQAGNTSETTETKHDRIDSKVKVQKVLIFKRPIFKNSSESTTESMVTISRTYNTGIFSNLSSIESSFIEVTAKAIIFWKTSLMALVIVVLIVSLSYYRRRIIRLKAEIIQKNLGNSFNQSCSYPQSTNAYTPTYFPRRNATNNSKYPNIVDSDYESSARSRSNYYGQTYYNSASLHSYESIDDQSNEHIYAEIGMRKGSIDSSAKPSNDERHSITDYVDYNHLDYTEPLETKAQHHYQALLIRVNEVEKPLREMESTYI